MGVHLFFRVLLHDESGVTAIEYALLGSLAAMAIVTSATVLGLTLEDLYGTLADEVCAIIDCEP